MGLFIKWALVLLYYWASRPFDYNPLGFIQIDAIASHGCSLCFVTSDPVNIASMGGAGEFANNSTSCGISRKSSTRSDPNQNLSLQDLFLEDDLLIEILCRIPTTESAFRCKLVCKHWCSFISSTYFVKSFIDQHIKHDDHDDGDCEYQKSLGILVNRRHPTWDGSRVTIDYVNPDGFNFRCLNLDYLPQKRGSVVVVASCNDLILCQAFVGVCELPLCHRNRFVGSLYCYYLCNPFTMQWLTFPRPPAEFEWEPYGSFGLICEPYHQRGGGINVEYRYRVVSFLKRLDDISEHVPLWTYHSEISQWIRSEFLGEVYSFGSDIVAYNGKFHWVNRHGTYLVTYDPFNMGQTSLIDGPDFSAPLYQIGGPVVGECNGVLRVMRMGFFSNMKKLNVWDLEGDSHGELRLILKHSVTFGTIHSRNSPLKEIFDGNHFYPKGLAFHPRNKDIVYMSLEQGNLFISYNLQSVELKVEGRFIGVGQFSYKLFPLVLPWWPTPILEAYSVSPPS